MTDVSAYLHSPALLKENKELDPFSDLSESLRQAQHSLVPQSPPIWPKFEIGIATYKSLGTSSLYYDFFTLPEQTYGIIIGEPSVKGLSRNCLFFCFKRNGAGPLSTDSTTPRNGNCFKCSSY